jgi:hypothetical protein
MVILGVVISSSSSSDLLYSPVGNYFGSDWCNKSQRKEEMASATATNITCIICYDDLSGVNPDLYPCNLTCGHSNLHVACAQKMVIGKRIKYLTSIILSIPLFE